MEKTYMIERYEPFENAEEVWFWFCACLQARADGLRSRTDYEGKPRPCEVGDIYKIIKRLKFNGQISNRQLRVMYNWGELHFPPYYDRRAKRSEIALWEEGIKSLETILIEKKIIINQRIV